MLSIEQVTALTAQAATAATYTAYDLEGNLLPDWVLNDAKTPVYLGVDIASRGVGVYGQSIESLVLVGLVKSSALSLITDATMVSTVLNTPAVWTGEYGINSLLDYLNYPQIQNLSQISLMLGAYQGLIDAGVLDGTEDPTFQAALIQPATKYGVTALIEWLNDEASAEISAEITITARQGQYAVDFINTYSADLNVAPDVPGSTNTTDRAVIDQVVTDIIGSSKIPPIEYVDTVANVVIPAAVNEEGIFRFAPGKPKG